MSFRSNSRSHGKEGVGREDMADTRMFLALSVPLLLFYPKIPAPDTPKCPGFPWEWQQMCRDTSGRSILNSWKNSWNVTSLAQGAEPQGGNTGWFLPGGICSWIQLEVPGMLQCSRKGLREMMLNPKNQRITPSSSSGIWEMALESAPSWLHTQPDPNPSTHPNESQ